MDSIKKIILAWLKPYAQRFYDWATALTERDKLVLAHVELLYPHANGATVLKSIEEATGKEPGIGDVIVSFDRLEEKGLLRRWEHKPINQRRRYYYGLTDQGKEELATWVATSILIP